MRSRLNNKAGFTLLELLLALVMLTVILGAIYSTFFLAHKAVGGVDDSLLKLQESRMFIDTLSREIEASFFDKTGRKKETVFKIEDRDIYGKQSSRLTFTALSPLRPGLSLITYYIEEHDGSMVLYKNILDPYRKYKDEEAPKPFEMLEGIESFTVDVRQGASWIRTWDTAEIKRVPDEVRVTLTFRVKDRPMTLYETMKPKIGKTL